MSDAIDVAAFRWAQAYRAVEGEFEVKALDNPDEYNIAIRQLNLADEELEAAEQALLHQVDLSVEPPS